MKKPNIIFTFLKKHQHRLAWIYNVDESLWFKIMERISPILDKVVWPIVAIAMIGLLVIIGQIQFQKEYQWINWADEIGLGGKTWWDWLELLVIPAVLALGALSFNRAERENDNRLAEARRKSDVEIAENRSQNEVLQNYLDKMSELILDRNLMEVLRFRKYLIEEQSINDEDDLEQRLPDDLRSVRDIAQVRTVTALRQLDGSRRGILLQFLVDADLADFVLVKASLGKMNFSNNTVQKINFYRADLVDTNFRESFVGNVNFNGAILIRADFSGVQLGRVKFMGAFLFRANFKKADMLSAIFNEAELVKVNFYAANLRSASFTDSNLTGAIFEKADLRDVRFTSDQLKSVMSLKGAIMPDGSVYDPKAPIERYILG